MTNKFRELLESEHDWPCEYSFKFIVPKEKLNTLLDLFRGVRDEQMSQRESKNGKFISITANLLVQTPEDVLELYEAAGKIEGVISL